MRVIDAHQHFWDPGRAAYDWLAPNFPELDRPIGFDELAPQIAAAGVEATVLVQSADNLEDSEYMFELASVHPEIAGVVAWVPLEDPRRASVLLERWRDAPAFVGVRNLIHTRDDPDWILAPDVDAGLGLLEEFDVPFDYVAVLGRHLEHVPRICERHPGLRLVIDHLAKPPVGRRDLEPWRSLIASAGQSQQVFAKVSGLYPPEDPAAWTTEDLRPVLEHALEVFGADRLMFGSDWPICEVAGGYATVTGALFAALGYLDEASKTAVFGGTASAFYRLDDRRAP